MTLPKKKTWNIYLYTDTQNFDIPDPIDSTKLIFLTTVETHQLQEPEETLVINFYDITETSASLGISWENTAVKIPIHFYTHEAMTKMIEKEMKQNVMDLNIAAAYYAQRNMELDQAKKLQEIVMQLRDEPSAWAYHEYGITLEKLNKNEEAIKAIGYSLQLAQESNNDYLIQENAKILSRLKSRTDP